MNPINTDISNITYSHMYSDKYKTDANNQRWVHVEEAKFYMDKLRVELRECVIENVRLNGVIDVLNLKNAEEVLRNPAPLKPEWFPGTSTPCLYDTLGAGGMYQSMGLACPCMKCSPQCSTY